MPKPKKKDRQVTVRIPPGDYATAEELRDVISKREDDLAQTDISTAVILRMAIVRGLRDMKEEYKL